MNESKSTKVLLHYRKVSNPWARERKKEREMQSVQSEFPMMSHETDWGEKKEKEKESSTLKMSDRYTELHDDLDWEKG